MFIFFRGRWGVGGVGVLKFHFRREHQDFFKVLEILRDGSITVPFISQFSNALIIVFHIGYYNSLNSAPRLI